MESRLIGRERQPIGKHLGRSTRRTNERKPCVVVFVRAVAAGIRAKRPRSFRDSPTLVWDSAFLTACGCARTICSAAHLCNGEVRRVALRTASAG
jgi:hypothetical protein